MTVVKAAAVEQSPVIYGRHGTVDKVVRTIHALGHIRLPFTWRIAAATRSPSWELAL